MVGNHFLHTAQEEFGKLIRRLREKSRISLRKAARALGVSPAFLSKAERGQRDLRKPEYVNSLATLLNQDVSGLRERAGLGAFTLETGFHELIDVAAKFKGMAERKGKDVDTIYNMASVALWTLVGVLRPALAEKDTKPLADTLRVLTTTVHRWYPAADMYGFYKKPLHPAEKALGTLIDTALWELYTLRRSAFERKLGTRLSEGR